MRTLLAAITALLLLAPAAHAEGIPSTCPGDPINVSQVITGTFEASRQGSYVLVPFDVPAGRNSVRVKYCFDQPQNASGDAKHTLDLGLYEPGGFGDKQFRGWGGSSHPDVTVTPQGFSTEAQYKARPKGHVPGRTTRGFLPGPTPAGQWFAELGVAAVVPQAQGDLDGRVAWRLEIEHTSIQPLVAEPPYQPARYNARPAKGRGWYEGDMHVHAEHSALGDATMTEVFDYGFRTAGLDFITLTDYVTPSSWGEVGRHQSRYRGKLIARSSEEITYRGHFMNHVSGTFVDYRTGPILRRNADGSLTQVRAAVPPRERFAQIRRNGGFTQINHPTIFPSDQPGNANRCRGCPWDYSDAETNFRAVDGWEVNTGPAAFGGTVANPFTRTAITEWDELRERNFRLTGVGVSDSHDAGSPDGPTESPVGNGRTVIHADELSEDGLRRAIQAGHAYVKTFRTSPSVRFTAKGGGRTADMGDALPGRRAALSASIRGIPDEDGWEYFLVKDGRTVDSAELGSSRANFQEAVRRRGEYRVQIERNGVVQTVTNPISVGDRPRAIPAGIRAGNRRAALRLRKLRVRRRGTTARVTFLARSNGGAPLTGVRVRSGRASGYTDSRGRVTLTLRRVVEPGRYRATATGRQWRRARTTFRVR